MIQSKKKGDNDFISYWLKIMDIVVMKIRILENEYWWGGRSYDGDIMPFSSKTEYLADLRDSCPNQAMPLFLSSKGRCIQSDAPFTIHFSNGEIHISNIRSEVNFSTLGSTLKECYLRAAQLYFNSNGKAPDTAVFEYPMYGTWIEIGPDLTQEKVMRYAKS